MKSYAGEKISAAWLQCKSTSAHLWAHLDGCRKKRKHEKKNAFRNTLSGNRNEKLGGELTVSDIDQRNCSSEKLWRNLIKWRGKKQSFLPYVMHGNRAKRAKMTMTVAAEKRERWRSAKTSKAVMNNRKYVQRDGKKVMQRERKKKRREHVRWILQIVGTSLACDVMMVMAWRCQLSTQAHMKQVKDDENAHAHHSQWDWENCMVRARAHTQYV